MSDVWYVNSKISLHCNTTIQFTENSFNQWNKGSDDSASRNKRVQHLNYHNLGTHYKRNKTQNNKQGTIPLVLPSNCMLILKSIASSTGGVNILSFLPMPLAFCLSSVTWMWGGERQGACNENFRSTWPMQQLRGRVISNTCSSHVVLETTENSCQ